MYIKIDHSLLENIDTSDFQVNAHSPFEDERFDCLYQATVSAYQLSENKLQCSRGKLKRWRDLAAAWYPNSASAKGADVFFHSIHYIHWGIYPEEPICDPMRKLIELITIELLSPGDAFSMWKKNDHYRSAFSKVVRNPNSNKMRGPRCHTMVFERYLSSRTWFEIVYKKRCPPMIDPLSSHHSIKAVCTHAWIQANCCGFEAVIKRLIPNAANWSRTQWSDDKHIYRYLKKTYAINCMKNDGYFDKLIWLLYGVWWLKSSRYLDAVISLDELPYPLVEKIWPDNTRLQVEEMFLSLCTRVKSQKTRATNQNRPHRGTFTYGHLVNSWIYKLVNSWSDDNTLSAQNRSKIRRSIFDLAMR